MSPDEVYRNPAGHRCATCDGTNEHVHAYAANGEVPTMPDGSTTAQAVSGDQSRGLRPLAPEGFTAKDWQTIAGANADSAVAWKADAARLRTALRGLLTGISIHNERLVGKIAQPIAGPVVAAAQDALAASVEAGPSRGADAPLAPEGLTAARITEYTIGSGDPLDWPAAIRVCDAGHGRWSVRRLNMCLAVDGSWEMEPMPSSRDDAFLARCRWPSAQAALAAVGAAAPPTPEVIDAAPPEGIDPKQFAEYMRACRAFGVSVAQRLKTRIEDELRRAATSPAPEEQPTVLLVKPHQADAARKLAGWPESSPAPEGISTGEPSEPRANVMFDNHTFHLGTLSEIREWIATASAEHFRGAALLSARWDDHGSKLISDHAKPYEPNADLRVRWLAIIDRLKAAIAAGTARDAALVIVDRATAARAADHLDVEANSLRDSHTVRGAWSDAPDNAEREAKADHDSMRACADALRAARVWTQA